jgi:hypothetical protein
VNRTDQLEQWASDLEDALTGAPDGMTRNDLMAAVGISRKTDFHRAKGVLQDRLGTTDTITMVGEPITPNSTGWTYSLQANASDPTAAKYQISKQRNLFLRMCRAYMVAMALVRGTPGNTAVGRAARRQARGIYRNLEDVTDVLTEMGMRAPVLPPRV